MVVTAGLAYPATNKLVQPQIFLYLHNRGQLLVFSLLAASKFKQQQQTHLALQYGIGARSIRPKHRIDLFERDVRGLGHGARGPDVAREARGREDEERPAAARVVSATCVSAGSDARDESRKPERVEVCRCVTLRKKGSAKCTGAGRPR